VLWLASWTVHNANHVRENADGLKVGGHQASSASLATIMTALYFGILRRRTASPSSRMRRRIFTPSSICSASRLVKNSRTFAATRAPSPILRAPRTLTTSISRQGRSGSVWRRPRSHLWCRIMCAPTGGGSIGRKAAWLR